MNIESSAFPEAEAHARAEADKIRERLRDSAEDQSRNSSPRPGRQFGQVVPGIFGCSTSKLEISSVQADVEAPVEPPLEEAVSKLLSKVGGTLEQALSLQELKWSSKDLDANDAKVVAHVIRFSNVLQKLVLGANYIGDAGAVAIADALKANGTLRTLVLGSLLGGNNIGDRGAIAMAEALKVNTVLQELYLSDNYIGDTGAVAIAEGLKVNVVLTTLWLTNNSIGDAGAVAIGEALRQNRRTVLTRLSLFRNRIQNKGSVTIAVALSSALASKHGSFSRFSPGRRSPNHRSQISKRPPRSSSIGGDSTSPLTMQEEQQMAELLRRPPPRRATSMPPALLCPGSTAMQQQLKDKGKDEDETNETFDASLLRQQQQVGEQGDKGTTHEGRQLGGDMAGRWSEALDDIMQVASCK